MTKSSPTARGAAGCDRGEATVELVVLVPLLMLTLLVAVQLAVHAHAAHVATAVASHGAAVAATPAGSAASGSSAARRIADELGAALASSPVVDVAPGDVAVQVSIVVPRIVPLFPSTVTRRVVEPKERLLREWER